MSRAAGGPGGFNVGTLLLGLLLLFDGVMKLPIRPASVQLSASGRFSLQAGGVVGGCDN